MQINNHGRTNSAARFTKYISKTLCEATRMCSATANITTRKLSSFSPYLCHSNISDEDKDSDVTCVVPENDRFIGEASYCSTQWSWLLLLCDISMQPLYNIFGNIMVTDCTVLEWVLQECN
jgi:hypothetical protein